MHGSRVTAGTVLTLALATQLPHPATAHADGIADQPPASTLLVDEKPPTAHCVEAVKPQRNLGLIIAGASVFGGIYTFNVLGGSLGAPYLYIPIVGPLLEADRAHSSTGFTYLAVLDTLAQTGGLVMLIAGIAMTSRGPIYRPLQQGQVSVAPYAGPGGAGLMALGRF